MRYIAAEGVIKRDVNKFKIFGLALAYIVALTTSVFFNANAISSFSNGFEVDTTGWFTDPTTINRVASGTNGINSSDGAFHAEVEAGAFTRWGGYESEFPEAGYTTTVDVYLDMALNPTIGTDLRFDYSSAINDPSGNHRRDFIYSVGTDPLVSGQFAISASNNSPGWPSNPARSPAFIDESGWYTFSHTFQDNGSGVLEVVMEVFDDAGNSVGTWTLSDPTDLIGTTVGGNRYGWFVTSDFSFLAIDNSAKENAAVINAPVTKDECKKDGWMNLTDDLGNPFKNQGDCVSYVASGGKNKADV